MPPPQQQQHPRDLIRNALAARQQQPELPIKGYHICFMMLSIIIAAIILTYQITMITSSEDSDDVPLNKWFNKNTKSSSIRYLKNIKDIKTNEYYDYIIIGAGTAGSILATKLSHFHNTYPRILVIEKSKSKRLLMQNKDNRITAFHYIYDSDQLQIQSINNHNKWIKSSLKKHQNNIWSIGHPSDYNILWNITDWNYNDIFPYFQSSEKVLINEIIEEFGLDITDENLLKLRNEKRQISTALMQNFISMLPLGPSGDYFSDKQFDFGNKDITKNRGDNGKLLIKQARKYSIVNAFIVNAMNANYEYNIDYNSFFNYKTDEENKMVNTVSYIQYNKMSIFESYFDKLKKSKFATTNKHMTVDVLFNTEVNKILFHDTQKTNDNKHIGIGVEVIYNSTKYNIYLRDDIERNNEIILSAGTVDSPRILMQSGFGNGKYLKECCDINVIENNVEIGNNLQDQIKFSVYFRHNPKFKVIAKYEIWKWKYKIFRGTMVNASGYDANMFYNPVSGDDDNIPQIQFMFYNGIRPTDIYNLDNEKCINTEIFDGITIDIILLHPKSNGFVDMNVINPKYLSDKNNQDLEMLLKGYREIERIFVNKEPWHGTVTFGPFWPCNESINNDDESIKKYIVNNVQTNNNWIGTNKMNVVVNNKFVLNNTLNVRIVDGSVMPSLISGSIQAPIVMMASRASDIIMKKRLGKNEQIDKDSINNNSDVSNDEVPRHSEL
eukprot:220552_1